MHCITISSAKLVVCTPDLAENVEKILPNLAPGIRAFAFEYGSFPQSSTPSIPLVHHADLPPLSPNFQRPKVGPNDLGNLIYTSGTTGNPKACAIQQGFIAFICATGQSNRGPPQLRTFSCMPLFHGTCFFTGLTMSAGCGGCFILARKFSARSFWKTAYLSRANKILYVGELCRYLLATPPGEYDRKHQVQIASGNGMRAEVWDKFKERFDIPIVQEYYRSTEVELLIKES